MKRVAVNKTIYDLLDHIRKRPGMYFHHSTLGALQNFLTGFSIGRSFSRGGRSEEPPFDNLSTWLGVHHNLRCAGAGGWYGAILDECGEGEKVFERFFDYLDAYRKREIELTYRFRLTAKQGRDAAVRNGGPPVVELRLTRCKGERCLFLHAHPRRQKRWYLACYFRSLATSRLYLKKVYGVTEAQWNRAIKGRD
jgi:hypothetical protein